MADESPGYGFLAFSITGGELDGPGGALEGETSWNETDLGSGFFISSFSAVLTSSFGLISYFLAGTTGSAFLTSSFFGYSGFLGSFIVTFSFTMIGTLAGSFAAKDLSAGTGYLAGTSLGTDIEVDGALGGGCFSRRSIFYLASARGESGLPSIGGAF